MEVSALKNSIHFIILLLVGMLLTACQSTIDPVHQEYIESYGWHVEKLIDQSTLPKNSLTEVMLENYQASGVDLAPYAGQELTATRYELEEEIGGRSVTAVLYEADGKIVAGHVVHPHQSPGVHPMDDRENVMKQEE
ncbi:hypothetical protein CBW65_01880 [Tumebacillus avium]|uniref:Uncharacterized protein n=1 Tax=Tumebacillus avium TaxID=1903704 RepID=A0A1Y0IJE5_9BACL|nr:hypothetical protein CBW65_01880 [Tumebacillus avium]